MAGAMKDILRKGFDEYRRYVNPLIAQRASFAGETIELVRVEGGVLQNRDGQPLEELHGTQTFGHKPPSVVAALVEFLQSDAPNWYPARVNPFSGRLARRLQERTGYDNAFFGCTGSDAVEAAFKLARALTRKPRTIALEGAYHGCTMGSLSLMEPGPFSDQFAPHVPGALRIGRDDVEALERELAKGDVAAVFVEPIQVEGGVYTLSDRFVEALCRLTGPEGPLLVADEIQTGLGRTGRGFLASEGWPRRPDVALMGKGLAGGLVPLSAMLTRREIFLAAYGKNFAAGESHNTTFAFNGVTATAALAALELADDAMVERCKAVGDSLRGALREAVGAHPLVADIRGEGLLCGVQLKRIEHPWLSFEHFGYPELADQSVIAPLVCHRLYPKGFFAFSCGHDWSVLRIQPRENIEMETLQAFAEAVREALDFIEELA